MCEHDDLDEFARRSSENDPATIRRNGVGCRSDRGVTESWPMPPRPQGADVEIKTAGRCRRRLFRTSRDGQISGRAHLARIFSDYGPRFKAMATRLAESGYSVLVINPFYRTKKRRQRRNTQISMILRHDRH